MNEHITALKAFADKSADAFEALVSGMSDEQKAYLVSLFEVGNSLSLSHTIHPDGTSAITFEVVFHDGSRRVLAAASGHCATVQ